MKFLFFTSDNESKQNNLLRGNNREEKVWRVRFTVRLQHLN